MPVKDTRRANLKALLDGLDPQRFRTLKERAPEIGVDASLASQILNETRDMGDGLARRVEQKVGLITGWMDLPHDPGALGKERLHYGTPNTEEGPKIYAVPLISWVQAGEWQEVVDNYRPGEGEKPVYTTRRVSPAAYALRIAGESMENPAGNPTFPNGSIVIIDPERQPENGRAVVVRLVNSKDVIFKQLVIEGGRKYLKPLNPRYPIIEIDESAVFCGVAVQVISDLD